MRKAITPVIATVLLVLITVVISVTAFIWINSTQTSIQESAGASIEGGALSGCSSVKLISMRGDGVTVQNTGCDTITNITLLIDGELTSYTLDAPIDSGESAVITYSNLAEDEDHTIKAYLSNGFMNAITSTADENTEEAGYGCSRVCDGSCQGSRCYGLDPDCDSIGIPTLACCGNDACDAGELAIDCPSDCKIDIIFFGDNHISGMNTFERLNYRINSLSINNPIYMPLNSSFIGTAYDNNDNAAVLFMPLDTGTTGYYNYNISYSFVNNTGYKREDVITQVYFTDDQLAYVIPFSYPTVDFFPDNNAVFAWSNHSALMGTNTMYYFIGNISEVSAYKELFSGANYAFPRISVNGSGIAHLLFTDLFSFYHSVYDRDADTWSSPESVLSGGPYLTYPKFVFNNSNALLFYAYSPDGTIFDYYYSYYDGSTFDTPVALETSIDDSCVSTNLGFDGEKWVLLYLTGDGAATNNCTMSYRTFNPAGGVSDPVIFIEQGLIQNVFPLYNNYHTSKSNAAIIVNYTESSSSPADVLYAYWNGSGFNTPQMIVSRVPSGGSCPFIYTYDGTGWYNEHEAYGFAVMKAWEYTSFEALEHLTIVNDSLYLDIREELDETSYTNQLSLLMVEHDPMVTVLPDIFGNIHTIREWVTPKTCSQNCLDEVSIADDESWITDLSTKDYNNDSELRDSLILTFDKPIGAVIPKLFLRLKESGVIYSTSSLLLGEIGSNNIRTFYDIISSVSQLKELITNWKMEAADLIISVYDGTEWVKVTSTGVGGAMYNDLLIELPEVNTDELRIKLDFSVHTYHFDEIKVEYSTDENVVVKELEMINPDARLLRDDDSYLALNKGDSYNLVFKAEECSFGKECSYIMGVKGYYEIYPPNKEVNLTLNVINKILYVITNPLETVRYAFKRVIGVDASLEELSPLDTFKSLIVYFFKE